MAMLTIAPLVNMCAWQLFDSGLDPTRFFNRQWMCTEVIECLGMSVLCLSFIDMGRHTVLGVELLGFLLLMVAAMCTVNVLPDAILPEFIVRLDHIHILDTCGLFLLCVVSAGQWHMKGLTIEYEISHPANRAKSSPSSAARHLGSSRSLHGHDSDAGEEHSFLVHRVVDEAGCVVETDA
jgi:hypothetical protein